MRIIVIPVFVNNHCHIPANLIDLYWRCECNGLLFPVLMVCMAPDFNPPLQHRWQCCYCSAFFGCIRIIQAFSDIFFIKSDYSIAFSVYVKARFF